MGQAVVRAFYHGTCTTFTPEMPDAAESDTSLCPSTTWQVDPDPDNVTCYEIVVQTKRCGCSGIEKESQTFERDVPCPASGPTRCPGVSHTCRHLLGTVAEEVFVECEEDRGYLVAEREFYKEQCCEYPSLSLPQCEEKTESYAGDKSIEHGEAFWRGLYGEHTRFVPILPERGCGKHITRQIVQPDDCCETAPPMTWNSDSSIDTVHDFDSGFVYVRDGIGPYVWRITGDGYLWFSGSATPAVVVTDERWAAIETGAYPCGKFQIEVTDSCGTVVNGEIVSTYGEWVERPAPARGWWEASDVPGVPFSDGDAEISLTTISWYPGLGGILAPAIVAVTGADASRVKYVQGIFTDIMFSTSIESGGYACKTEDGCPLTPEAYGQSFTLPETGDDAEFWLGEYGIAINCDDPYDCRGRIYDPSWAMLLGAEPSGAPSYAELEVFSGDFAMNVSDVGPDSGCALGRHCGITMWVKCFSYNVRIYDWSC